MGRREMDHGVMQIPGKDLVHPLQPGALFRILKPNVRQEGGIEFQIFLFLFLRGKDSLFHSCFFSQGSADEQVHPASLCGCEQ